MALHSLMVFLAIVAVLVGLVWIIADPGNCLWGVILLAVGCFVCRISRRMRSW